MALTIASAAPTARRYHLGCGDDRLDGFVNVDIRETAAADMTLDLNTLDLPAGSAELLFSNAMFEHLRRPQREIHLRGARAALDPAAGAICYIGIPYFKEVARLYLDRGPGVVGDVFDLFNVYRYTHGDPEAVDGWYFEQLHKSLFDEDELDSLLSAAGFGSHTIFHYAYPDDRTRAMVTMGFYATARPAGEDELRAAVAATLAPFHGRRLLMDSLRHLLVRARGEEAFRAEPIGRGGEEARRLHEAALEAFGQGRTADAADALRRSIRSSVDLTTINDLAVALAAAGQSDEAEALLRACLAIDATRSDARANLAALDLNAD